MPKASSPISPSPARAAPAAGRAPRSDDLIRAVREAAFDGDPEFGQFGADPADLTTRSLPKAAGAGPVNYLFAAGDDPHDPDDVFRALRWGGVFAYADRDRRRVAELADRYAARGYEVARPAAVTGRGLFGLRVPFLSRKIHYFVARRVSLTLPKEVSERFTYHLRLVREHPPSESFTPDPILGGYVVQKEVPSVERVSARLRHKFPEAPDDLIRKRALKFTEKIFPVFLTREAAVLKILERDLPIAYRDRVPKVIGMEQDDRGYVRRLWINWLRAAPPAGRALSQLEFARQAADLLRVIHDEANIIHLDLRLDNVVVTDRGVGFVDFGSSVREGENIQNNPLLATIFDELMRTSQIQRMLDKMMSDGSVTSSVLGNAYGKVDKGVDLFYLAVSINAPLTNPDFRGLVGFDPNNADAAGLSTLTQDVLKPRDPSNPPIRSSRDLLRSIEGLAWSLRMKGEKKVLSAEC